LVQLPGFEKVVRVDVAFEIIAGYLYEISAPAGYEEILHAACKAFRIPVDVTSEEKQEHLWHMALFMGSDQRYESLVINQDEKSRVLHAYHSRKPYCDTRMCHRKLVEFPELGASNTNSRPELTVRGHNDHSVPETKISMHSYNPFCHAFMDLIIVREDTDADGSCLHMLSQQGLPWHMIADAGYVSV
jgi:hypothetical protein